MSTVIQECNICFLSQERASALVPPEYPVAWKWFATNAGRHIDRLPMGEDRPEDLKRLGITLTRQAGIHCPNYDNLTSGGEGRSRYALSVHSQGSRIYPDREKLDRGDGTWLLAYSAQTGTDPNQGYNETLRNCMRDGIPLGVFVASPSGGYDVLGLAFVERFNTVSKMFTLHGPVTDETVSCGAFALFDQSGVAPEDQVALDEWDTEDERKRAVAEHVVRERQDRFRSAVFGAYGGACAITGVKVPQVL